MREGVERGRDVIRRPGRFKGQSRAHRKPGAYGQKKRSRAQPDAAKQLQERIRRAGQGFVSDFFSSDSALVITCWATINGDPGETRI